MVKWGHRDGCQRLQRFGQAARAGTAGYSPFCAGSGLPDTRKAHHPESCGTNWPLSIRGRSFRTWLSLFLVPIVPKTSKTATTTWCLTPGKIDDDGRAILAPLPLLSIACSISLCVGHSIRRTGAPTLCRERSFATWLTSKRLVSCRKLVVWLMRHTTPLNNGSHCPQIVWAAFGLSTAVVMHRQTRPASH